VLIDWFTVFAQIINFLVLVFLLKKFLYGPIIKAMDRREGKIALRMQEAEQKNLEAEQEVSSYRKKTEEINKLREDMIAQTREESEVLRRQLIKKTKEEVEDLKSRWHETILQEKESFLRNLQKLSGEHVYAIARQVLTDMADTELEDHIVDVFIGRIKELSDNNLKKIKESVRKSDKSIIISSSFEIKQNKRQLINHVLHTSIAPDMNIQYAVSHDLICGIEIKVHDYIVGWNLEEYLKSLHEAFNNVLEEEVTGKRA
jgi:F-type H+-transporting ATPase subunit b